MREIGTTFEDEQHGPSTIHGYVRYENDDYYVCLSADGTEFESHSGNVDDAIDGYAEDDRDWEDC